MEPSPKSRMLVCIWTSLFSLCQRNRDTRPQGSRCTFQFAGCLNFVGQGYPVHHSTGQAKASIERRWKLYSMNICLSIHSFIHMARDAGWKDMHETPTVFQVQSQILQRALILRYIAAKLRSKSTTPEVQYRSATLHSTYLR